MKLKEKTQEQLVAEAFAIFNGGEGLDHWSYSSTSSPFAKNIISYTFLEKIRRSWLWRYKPSFGNLVNNTVQRLIADEIWKTKTIKETEWDRDYQKCFDEELNQIKKKDPVDDKDKFAREEMISYAHDCIGVTKKVVKDLVGDDKLICEQYVKHKEMTMIKPITGRVDYLTDKIMIELKTKPPNIRKVRNKEEWTMSSQALPTEPTLDNLTQTSFYYMCTKKIPYLIYVNDKEHITFDQSHELMKKDHLEYLYFKMCEKILLWERMIMFCKGNISELALMCEPPDMYHPFYYKDLADEQKQLITKLWGIKHE
tara:strand:- start:180 stop:1115 length:936 start_codon:yes stop_codon:yes gene_type:complete